MPTTQCSCGEQLHYTADKVGFIARCRCGRPVRLPEPKPEPARKSQQQLFDDERRSASVRRQILAVLLVLVVTAVAVVLVSIYGDLPSHQQQPRSTAVPGDAEP